MLLRIWQNLQTVINVLSDPNDYRMYSTIITEGLDNTMVLPDTNNNPDQAILDVREVRILPMSHKYNPSSMHAGLLIFSVDGETDFILNDSLMRIKSGDVLIHQIHNALSGTGDIDAYRDLIRTLFGTHRVNLVGLVFTFSGRGQFNDCMRWNPMPLMHTSPIHPTEQKIIEIILVSLYMNDVWQSMPISSHTDVEVLAQTAKKQYLLKLGEIEQLYSQRRKTKTGYSVIGKLLRHHLPKNFQTFEWTASRQRTFDETMQRLLDNFYSLILNEFEEGEFDRDQYIHYDDKTQRLFSVLANLHSQGQQLNSTPKHYLTLPEYH